MMIPAGKGKCLPCGTAGFYKIERPADKKNR